MEIRSILVPLDFSDCSMRALAWAVSLASASKARLTLLHVTGTEARGASGAVELIAAVLHDVTATPGPRPSVGHATPDERAVALESLEGVRKSHVPGSLEGGVVVRDGHAGDVIADEAKTAGHDLVVMGTRGRSGVERVMMGSVAERVLRHAPTAVLIVR